jgi:hypothetical protein
LKQLDDRNGTREQEKSVIPIVWKRVSRDLWRIAILDPYWISRIIGKVSFSGKLSPRGQGVCRQEEAILG